MTDRSAPVPTTRTGESSAPPADPLSRRPDPEPLPEFDVLQAVVNRFWRPWIPLLALLLLTLLALNLSTYWVPTRDGALYLSLARSLAAGHGYQVDGIPHTLVFPGFPLMLAAVVGLFGENFFFLNLLITLFGVASLVLVWLLLRPWLGSRLAVVVTLITGTSETFLLYSSRVLTDVPHLFFVLLALWLIQQMWFQPTPTRRVVAAVLAGAVVMLASMIRPNGLVLVPVALAALFYRKRNPMSLREKLTALFAWIVAIGAPFFYWYRFIENVDVSLRSTYFSSSSLIRGFAAFARYVYRQTLTLPGQVAETLSRNELTLVGNIIVLILVVIGFVRLARRGAWHLSFYSVLATGFLAMQLFNRRYLLAILPLLVIAFLLGTTWLLYRLQRLRPRSRALRKSLPFALVFLILFFPLANAYPVFKLTRERYLSPFYQKFEEGRWRDRLTLADWMQSQTPPDTVYWTRYNYIYSYLSHRIVRGPFSAYRGPSPLAWSSTNGLLRDFARWKPDYLIVDSQSDERRRIDKFIQRSRLHAVRVEVPEVHSLRIYRLLEPPALPPS